MTRLNPAPFSSDSANRESTCALAAEKHKIAAWVRENFAEGWATETEIAFGRQPISCFIAVREGRAVGFACHDATFRNFFGPTGVKLEVRKNGIGTGLLFACLEDIRQQGYGYAIVGAWARRPSIRKRSAQCLSKARSPGFIGGCFVAPVRNFERVIC
jgi:hypothetical protein